MIVRNEIPLDFDAIRRLVIEAFGRTDEADLVRSLEDAGDGVVSLVAETDGVIIGHVLLSKMAAPFRALALAPVSVTPVRQGSGVGSMLVREAMRQAREGGWDAVFVLGDSGYYDRFGFSVEAARGFRSPYAGRHFAMLALTREPLATAGDLRHAPAFAVLD
jgi:putative acetyltransferase